MADDWKRFRKTAFIEARPLTLKDLTRINTGELKVGAHAEEVAVGNHPCPEIQRTPTDAWIISADYFEKNYQPLTIDPGGRLASGRPLVLLPQRNAPAPHRPAKAMRAAFLARELTAPPGAPKLCSERL